MGTQYGPNPNTSTPYLQVGPLYAGPKSTATTTASAFFTPAFSLLLTRLGSNDYLSLSIHTLSTARTGVRELLHQCAQSRRAGAWTGPGPSAGGSAPGLPGITAARARPRRASDWPPGAPTRTRCLKRGGGGGGARRPRRLRRTARPRSYLGVSRPLRALLPCQGPMPPRVGPARGPAGARGTRALPASRAPAGDRFDVGPRPRRGASRGAPAARLRGRPRISAPPHPEPRRSVGASRPGAPRAGGRAPGAGIRRAGGRGDSERFRARRGIAGVRQGIFAPWAWVQPWGTFLLPYSDTSRARRASFPWNQLEK